MGNFRGAKLYWNGGSTEVHGKGLAKSKDIGVTVTRELWRNFSLFHREITFQKVIIIRIANLTKKKPFKMTVVE